MDNASIYGKNFINNEWIEGLGVPFSSIDQSTNEILWQGKEATIAEVNAAIESAALAKPKWAQLSIEERLHFLNNFQKNIQEHKQMLAQVIAREMGKPLWEAQTEVIGVINKLPISVKAYEERCANHKKEQDGMTSRIYFKPHGIIVVLGPFNFPLHLPNAHIIPALLAGNTVVFKPSELTPGIAEVLIHCYQKANLPKGVINMVQGSGKVGKMLSEHPKINGLYFTGSSEAGQKIADFYAKKPGKILALECGGNNPLIVHEMSDIKACVYNTIQSAYLTAGQRCTCARRLIVTKNKANENFIAKLILAIQKIKVGFYNEEPPPFMGPVISIAAKKKIQSSYEQLVKQGAKVLVPLKEFSRNEENEDLNRLSAKNDFTIQNELPNQNGLSNQNGLLRPGLIDVTHVSSRPDEEIFGPLLQLIWVNNFEEALEEANNTEYGLVAGLLSDKLENYQQFLQHCRVGVVAWNRPTTGGSSELPFGGIGKSGNFRPSGYFAADYCAYPVASQEFSKATLPMQLSPGIDLE